MDDLHTLEGALRDKSLLSPRSESNVTPEQELREILRDGTRLQVVAFLLQ